MPVPRSQHGATSWPNGWSIVIDPGVRRIDGGLTWIGGSPLRILRFRAEAASILEDLVAGRPAETKSAGLVAAHLVRAGLASPIPTQSSTVGTVAVVIPVLDDSEGLEISLNSLRAPIRDGTVVRVVVVDDGSSPMERRRLQTVLDGASDNGFPVELICLSNNRGPGAARNSALPRLQEPLTLLLDAGIGLESGPARNSDNDHWLGRLSRYFEEESIAAVAPRVRPSPTVSPAGFGARSRAAYEAVRSSLDLGSIPSMVKPGARVPYVPTAALLLRTDCLREVDGFDESLRFGEDVDLVWRVAARSDVPFGQVRYAPEVVLTHPSRPTGSSWLRQRFNYGTAAGPLADRHQDAVAPLRVSGWSALAWALVVAGYHRLGVFLALGSTAALAPKLRGLEHPWREAVAIAGRGNLYAVEAVGDALRRPWWPLTVTLMMFRRPSRPATVSIVVATLCMGWRRERPNLDPLRYGIVRQVDDMAYGTGVWVGAWRQRSVKALLPAFTGRIPKVPRRD